MQFDIQKIRSDFPALFQKVNGKPLTYLDNGATALKPKLVIDKINEHYSLKSANIHRGVHTLSSEATIEYENARKKIQRFINAKSEREIIFTSGTTGAINLLAYSLVSKFLNAGDEILLSEMEHHSNIVPWQLAAERHQLKIKVIPVLENGTLDLDAFKKLLGPKTKLLSIVHVSNSLGTINPVEEMIKLAHANQTLVIVDGAQSVIHLPIDVTKLDADFFVFSGHKILGPTGVGILYGKEQLLEQMPPFLGGGDMIESVSFEKTTYAQLPAKFEAGTPHIAGAIGLGAAIDYLKALPLEEVYKYERMLLATATEKLSQIKGLRIIGTAKDKAGVISFVLGQIHPHDIGTILDQEGIAVRTGHHCTQPLMKALKIPATARASFNFYNDLEDVERLYQGICKVEKFFS